MNDLYTGLVLAQLFISFVEAGFFPGALYHISLFYSRTQYAFPVAVLYFGSQLDNAFGDLFAVGIQKLDGMYGIEGWRWVNDSSGVLKDDQLAL